MGFVKRGDDEKISIVSGDSDLMDDETTRRALAKAKAKAKDSADAVPADDADNKTEQQ